MDTPGAAAEPVSARRTAAFVGAMVAVFAIGLAGALVWRPWDLDVSKKCEAAVRQVDLYSTGDALGAAAMECTNTEWNRAARVILMVDRPTADRMLLTACAYAPIGNRAPACIPAP